MLATPADAIEDAGRLLDAGGEGLVVVLLELDEERRRVGTDLHRVGEVRGHGEQGRAGP